MAGERIGKTYEAIIEVALEELKSKGVIDEEIFWNKTPAGISVEPDFLIGTDVNHPSVIFMVTHSGSSKNSDMKCWRNLGELCEVKTSLSPSPSAINIIFDSTIKPGIKAIQESSFDYQVSVGDVNYGAMLLEWAKRIEPELPTDQEEKAKHIRRMCAYSKSCSKIITSLATDIENGLRCEKTDNSLLWEMENLRQKCNPSAVKTTFVRRGMSKLLVFDNIELAIRIYRNKTVKTSEVPDYAFSLGFIKKAIGKVTPSDIEIQSVFELLSDNEIKMLYHSMDENETVHSLVSQLRGVSAIEIIEEHCKTNCEYLMNADELQKRLIMLHDSPTALVAENAWGTSGVPGYNWLFAFILELIKASTKTANGYGIAQLANDVVSFGFGTEADKTDAGQFGGGLGLSAWVARKSSPLRDDLIKGISVVLSNKLGEIGIDKCIELIEKHYVRDTMINNVLEAKLCTYRMFEPLYLLLSSKISGIQQVKLRTCFAEKAGLGGMSGKTTVALFKHTIINWQSASDAGRDHKRKELCGRAVGLRYTWDVERCCYVKRPGIQKLILLLDGTWRQKDIDALIAAGWDEIYYPDEIDKLKAAIV